MPKKPVIDIDVGDVPAKKPTTAKKPSIDIDIDDVPVKKPVKKPVEPVGKKPAPVTGKNKKITDLSDDEKPP